MQPNYKKTTKDVFFFLFQFFILSILILQIVLFDLKMLNSAFTYDTAWLIETGKYIIENKGLPTEDIFSWTIPSKIWTLYQWLFELIIAFYYSILGEDLLVRLFTIFVVSIYLFIPLLVSQFRKTPLIYTFLISPLCLYIASVNITIRPMVATLFFLLIQYLLVELYRNKKIRVIKLSLILIPIYVLWANMHLGVAVGFLSLLLFALGDYIENKFYVYKPDIHSIKTNQIKIKNYFWLILVTFISSLINPYGYKIYNYLIYISTMPYLNKIIIELQPPYFQLLNYKALILLLLILILLLTRANKVFLTHELLHIITFTVLTLSCQRFIVWTCLFYALLIPRSLHYFALSIKKPFPLSTRQVNSFPLFNTLNLTILFLATFCFLFFPKLCPSTNYGTCKKYTAGIKVYQTLQKPTDRLLNDPYIGSCSIAINPKQKVFIDTRFDFYGEEFTKQFININILKNNEWKSFFDKWRINTVLLDKNMPLSNILKESNDFKILFEDNYVVIFKKIIY